MVGYYDAAAVDVLDGATHSAEVWFAIRSAIEARNKMAHGVWVSRQAYQALKSLATHKPIATTREVWRIWLALASSSPCM